MKKRRREFIEFVEFVEFVEWVESLESRAKAPRFLRKQNPQHKCWG